MRTWTFEYVGQIPSTRKFSGSGIQGTVAIRATSLDEALSKFNLGFDKAVITITSIKGNDA